MNRKKTFGRRLAALAGVLTIGLAGYAGPASATSAASIDPDATGSITVYKHVEDEADSKPGAPAGAPLEGVEFTLERVVCDSPLDLTNDTGWQTAEAIVDANAVPAGCALVQVGAAQVTDHEGRTVFTNLDLGLYLVTETGSGDNLIAEPAAPFWVTVPMPNTKDGSWTYDVVAYPKNVLGEFTTSKMAGDTQVKLGDQVAWTITSNVPATDLPYNSFSIEDDLSGNAYLDVVSWGAVSVDGTALAEGTHYTITGGAIVFTAAGRALLDGGASVTAVINTTVKAIPADGAIVNEARVKLNGTPSEPQATTNFGELMIEKVSSDNGVDLAGAEFSIYDRAPNADGTAAGNLVASGTTAADGTVKWTLWVGNDSVVSKNFWLRETKAPAGHVLPADPWTAVTVNAGAVSQAQYTIVNHKPEGPNLPLTGAGGTLAMTIGGAALVLIGAGTAVAARRRSNNS
ncbi:SpaH/EbpB family LPXTG-anchored major pilin [Actinomycetaceae bacterium L2_0104]